VVLWYTKCCYAECRNLACDAMSRRTECRFTQCRGAIMVAEILSFLYVSAI
jgi:hypothetical protein